MHQPLNSNIPHQSLYDLIGGKDGILKLVKLFYDTFETNPEGHKLHLLH